MRREPDCLTAAAWPDPPAGVEICEMAEWLYSVLAQGLLLEGTQGSGLSLLTGQFPFVTSRDTNLAGLCADAALAPQRVTRVVLVARSYPIRVAGRSGPFWPGSQELSWSELGLEPEHTTVTGRERRVGSFSLKQLEYAARLNAATELALTFADYLDPEISGRAGAIERSALRAYPRVAARVDEIEKRLRIPVRLIGTGPASMLALR